MSKDTIGDRMKESYENRYRFYFPNRLPIIIRIDGKAFHTYTKGLNRPFDKLFMTAMQKTTLDLVKNIGGCKLGYVQSDEISLLLTNDDTLQTQPWFDNNLQKIVSVSASMATLYFNKYFQELKNEWLDDYNEAWHHSREDDLYYFTLLKKEATAMFDSRAFVIPKEEVNNYFYWRQLDASRNSILSCAQSYIGKKQIHGIKCDVLKEKLLLSKGMDWEALPADKRHGSCVIFRDVELDRLDEHDGKIIRRKPVIDKDIPNFSENPDYINDIVYHKEK